MKANRGESFLVLPVPYVVRRITCDLLDQVRLRLPGLHQPDDEDALHDIRVNLRKLHSYLKLYRTQFKDTVSSKRIKELKRLASETNHARDSEVQLDWLKKQSPGTPEEEAGFTWYDTQLSLQVDHHYRMLQNGLYEEQLTHFTEILRQELQVYHLAYSLESDLPLTESYAQATSALLQQHTQQLIALLNRLSEENDRHVVHKSRIAVKQLRYLIDPLHDSLSQWVSPMIQQMKYWQNLFGQWHDSYIHLQALNHLLTSLHHDHEPRYQGIFRLVELEARREQDCFSLCIQQAESQVIADFLAAMTLLTKQLTS